MERRLEKNTVIQNHYAKAVSSVIKRGNRLSWVISINLPTWPKIHSVRDTCEKINVLVQYLQWQNRCLIEIIAIIISIIRSHLEQPSVTIQSWPQECPTSLTHFTHAFYCVNNGHFLLRSNGPQHISLIMHVLVPSCINATLLLSAHNKFVKWCDWISREQSIFSIPQHLSLIFINCA